MKSSSIWFLTLLNWLLLSLAAMAADGDSTPARAQVRITDETTGTVSPLLFGQMLERWSNSYASIEEHGVQAAMDENGRLRPDVRFLFSEMEIPLVRFPGGAQVDSPNPLRWTELIDPPEGTRPDFFTYGYAEFFSDARSLGWRTILPVNFRAIMEADDSDLERTIEEACAVVAWATADAEASPWGERRAQSGHPAPFAVDYLQVGNEWVGFLNERFRRASTPEAFEAEVQNLKNRLLLTIQHLRKAAPGIPIISDVVIWPEETYDRYAAALDALYSEVGVREAIDFATVHIYRPWEIKPVRKNGEPVETTALDPAEVWLAMQSVPEIDPAGLATLSNSPHAMRGFELVRKHGLPLVITEWNWNGWGTDDPVSGSLAAKAHASANFFHAFFRQGNIHLATQSMLVGNNWAINAVRVPPKGPAYLHPTAVVTGFYQRHSGREVLRTEVLSPQLPQPVELGQIAPVPALALVDAITTRDEKFLYVHLIHRAWDTPTEVRIDLPTGIEPQGQRYSLEVPLPTHSVTELVRHEGPVELALESPLIQLPPRSITVLKFPRSTR